MARYIQIMKNQIVRFYKNHTEYIQLYTVAFAMRFVIFAMILFFVGEKGLELGDSINYLDLAHSIQAGQGFAVNGMPFFFRTIGYPLFLVGGLTLFRSIAGFILFQILFASLLPLIIKKLSKQLGFSEKVALLSAYIVALEPHLVFYSVTVMTESIYTLILFAGCVCVFQVIQHKKYISSLCAGILFGIGMLIKPLLQAFPFVVCVSFIPMWKKIQWKDVVKHSAIILAISFMICMPWMYRNYITFHSFALSNQGSGALLGYLGTSIISVRDQIPYADAEKKVLAEFSNTYGENVAISDRGKLYNIQAIGYLKSYPFIFLKLIAINTVTYWTSSNYNSFLNYYHLVPAIDHSVLPPTHYLAQGRMREFFTSFWKIFLQPFYIVGVIGRLIWTVIFILFLLGIWNAFVLHPAIRFHTLFLIALCVYFTIIVWVDGLGIEARLRYPLMPIEILYAVYGWGIVHKKYGIKFK